MLSDKESVRGIESFYDDLVGLEVSVPCSTWAHRQLSAGARIMADRLRMLKELSRRFLCAEKQRASF